MAAGEVTLPDGFVLDEPTAGLPEGFVSDDAGLPAGFVLDAAQADPEAVRAEQAEIVGRMSSDFGGLAEDGGEGAGISLGAAIRSAPFLAALGQRFVGAKRGVSELFSTKEESERLAQMTADEAVALKQHFDRNPDEAAAFALGQGTGTIAEAVTLARYIPGPAKVGITGSGVVPSAARVGYGSAVGGGVAATHVTQPGESKAEQVGKGALFSGGLTGITEALSAAARPLASLFTTKKGAEGSGGLLRENPAYERGLKLQEETGVKLSPGQVTGSTSLSEMRPPKGFAETQAKQTLRHFVKVRDEFSANPKPPAALAEKFQSATDDIYKQLVDVRRRVGDFRYGQFRKSVKEIYADKLMTRMDDLAKDAVPGTEAGKITLLRNQLAKQLEESGGSLTPDQVLGWKERIDALLTGKSDIFKDLSKANQRRMGGQLMDSLYDSLTATADTLALQGKLSPATLLKQAVADYKKFSAPLKELEESALGALFRNKDGAMTPERAARALMQLEPTQVRGVYRVLEQYNPNLIREYQATKLYNAMRESVKLTPETAGRLASQTKFNPQAALKELTRKDGLRAAFEQDPALLRRVRNGVALLDRVADRLTSGSGGAQGLQSRGAEVARNVFSGSPVFIAGTAAKVLGPAGLWKLTSSDTGLAVLRSLARAPLNSPQYAAALEDLVMNLDDAPAGE